MVSWFVFQGQREKKQVVYTPSCDLWDLVLDMDWERVVEHAKEFPLDAEWMDGHWHESPLYLACQSNAPLAAVQAIIDAYPKAILTHSRANKDLPLHIACRYQADEAILAELVKLYPVTAVEQTLCGRTPIMALWEFRPESNAAASNATGRDDGEIVNGTDDNQDEIFWRKILVLLVAVARFREEPEYRNQVPATRSKKFRNAFSSGQVAQANQLSTCKALPTTVTSTSTMTTTTVRTTTGGFIVHAAASLGSLSCPVQVLEFALRRAPKQASQRDCWGQLPLHIAVGPTLRSNTTRRKYKPREREFIRRLLAAYPGAAREQIEVDNGRFPLHAALANRHTWSGGVDCLFHAAPELVFVPDPTTKLYPFQLAAVPVGDNLVELDTIYHLFRSQPDVLERMDLDQREGPKPVAPPHLIRSRTKNRPRILKIGACPHGLRDAMFGTLTAVLIGSVAGMLFPNTLDGV